MKELKYENRRNKIKIIKGNEAVYKKIYEKRNNPNNIWKNKENNIKHGNNKEIALVIKKKVWYKSLFISLKNLLKRRIK